MSFFAKAIRASACAAVFFFTLADAPLGLGQQAEPGPRLERRGPPATPVYSRDGGIVVYAPAAKAGYRAPVLSFVDRTREAFKRTTRLKLDTQACVLEIVIGGKSDGDSRVLTARLRDPDGNIHERIELPDPEAADLEKLKRAVCAALLRGWMAAAGGTDATVRELPVWLLNGVVRNMDREVRQADLDRTLLLWSRACLAPAGELFAADSLAASREPAVAAVLAGWFLEKRANVNLFEVLLRGAATGKAWSAAGAAQVLAETDDLMAFDAFVDGRLMAAGRVVFEPGLTTAGIVRRFRSHLLLFASFFDKTIGGKRAFCSFHEAAMYGDDREVRLSAAAQALRVRMAAVGRDGMLLAVSDAYVAFLEAVARGRKQGELSRLLMEAERLRKELEGRTAQGAVLKRTVDEGGGRVSGAGGPRGEERDGI